MSLRISSFSLSPFIVSSMRKKEEREGDDIKRHVIINISIPWNFATSIATVIHLKFFLISESRVNNCKNIYFFRRYLVFYIDGLEEIEFFFSPQYISFHRRSDPIHEIRTIMEARTCGPLDHPYVGRTKRRRKEGSRTYNAPANGKYCNQPRIHVHSVL